LGHDLRNPLTAVRALAELLPDQYADPDFRARFATLVGEGLTRVEEALERLDRLAAFPPPMRQAIDVGGLLEEVLDKRRGRIHERRLLVLEELDRARPRALADPEQLRFVFEALLDAAIGLVPERGHVYVASKRNSSGLRGGPSVRVLLRYRGPQVGPTGPQRTDLAPAANALDVALAEIVTRAQGGTLTLDTSDHSETVIIVDLPS
jgi:signal transduction histidine kinase